MVLSLIVSLGCFWKLHFLQQFLLKLRVHVKHL